MKEAGIPVRPSMIWSASFDREQIQAVCRRKLNSANAKPSALFTTNGVTGIGALRSLYDLGFSTPEDIAFATIDELISEDLFQPRITSVVQPTYEIGYRAVEVLLGRIALGGVAASTTKVRLAASLVIRDSSRLRRSKARR